MKFEEETVKEQVITRIKQTNNPLLLKKIAKLLDTEQSDTFWTKLTAELRAEIEQDKNKGKHELDRAKGILQDEIL
jgi:predicted Zn-ribbon and HTH transcriptional regulator